MEINKLSKIQLVALLNGIENTVKGERAVTVTNINMYGYDVPATHGTFFGKEEYLLKTIQETNSRKKRFTACYILMILRLAKCKPEIFHNASYHKK